MYNAPPPNVMQGIRLVQAGRKAEALPYLRYAAQSEVLTSEAWLWLAAATDNLDEYRYCINQALHLDPYHPVAGRMRRALEDLDHAARRPQPTPDIMQPVQRPVAYGQSPAAADAYFPARQDSALLRRRPSWLRRIARAVVLALLIGGCIGISTALIASGELTNLARDWLQIEELHTLDFTVGETPGYRFRMEVPGSWQPANLDNASWRAAHDDLAAALPDSGALLDSLDERFSVVVRDPVYGAMMPLIRLVETDAGQIAADGMIATLTLHEIVPLPEPPPGDADTVCARMHTVEAQFIANVGFAATAAGSQVLMADVDVREEPDDCVFTIERLYSEQRPDQVPAALSEERAPAAIRDVVIAVPVGGRRYAVWQMVYADSAAATYDYAIERLTKTLEYVP